MHRRLFSLDLPEDSDLTAENIYRYLTTSESINPETKITVIEQPNLETEFANCCLCGEPIKIIRHTIKKFVCGGCR